MSLFKSVYGVFDSKNDDKPLLIALYTKSSNMTARTFHFVFSVPICPRANCSSNFSNHPPGFCDENRGTLWKQLPMKISRWASESSINSAAMAAAKLLLQSVSNVGVTNLLRAT